MSKRVHNVSSCVSCASDSCRQNGGHREAILFVDVPVDLDEAQQLDLVHALVEKVFVILDDLHTDHAIPGRMIFKFRKYGE